MTSKRDGDNRTRVTGFMLNISILSLHFKSTMKRDSDNKELNIGTEDIVAIGCVVVAIIIAIGLLTKTIDIVGGGLIIAGLLSAGSIAKIISLKRSSQKG
ncbi:MAG: hypothetical protein KAI64_07620 [Thermoplasmata archaeon]|nr:hypothetical protein [Thermoplasmata archaeon]